VHFRIGRNGETQRPMGTKNQTAGLIPSPPGLTIAYASKHDECPTLMTSGPFSLNWVLRCSTPGGRPYISAKTVAVDLPTSSVLKCDNGIW
jgi:hypothetical protein